MPTAMQELLKQREGFIPLNTTDAAETPDGATAETPPTPPAYSGPAIAPVSMPRAFNEAPPPARAMVNALAESYGVTFAQALAWCKEQSAEIDALA